MVVMESVSFKNNLCGKCKYEISFIVFLALIIQDQPSCWSQISKDCIDDDEIMFNILCKVDRSYMSPEDLLPVLEGTI
jgi:hypothetical protein